MLILVKICMGGVAQIALFAKFTPLYLEKIYLQISILKTNFAPTLIKNKSKKYILGTRSRQCNILRTDISRWQGLQSGF